MAVLLNILFGPYITPAALVLLPILVTSWFFRQSSLTESTEAPRLAETVPFVSNAWQFMTNKRQFINRVRDALRTSPVIRCRLGPMDLHLVTGGSNVSAIFRSSFISDPWVLRILGSTGGYATSELAKFAEDDTGSATLPRRGSSGPVAFEKRIWYGLHRMEENGLINFRAVDAFVITYQELFLPCLTRFPVGKWVADVRVYEFLKLNMASAATQWMMGSKVLDVNPDFIEAFWDYEQFGESLSFGLPKCLTRKAVTARERFRLMCLKWYKAIDQKLDMHDASAAGEPSWDPIIGSRISREMIKWAKAFEFSDDSLGAAYALLLFGLHANSIPVCAWVILEIVKDPALLCTIREEISQAQITGGPQAGAFNYQKLASMPLLQSIYTEVLRVHISILVTRIAIEDVTLGGYTIPRGSTVQAPTEVAHLDEEIWGVPGHPASDFWAYRHVKEVMKSNSEGETATRFEFSMGGPANCFFPFGGGTSICAGRNIAKPEVLLTVAMILSRFEVEFVRWENLDGSVSGRPAQNNAGYANAVATPPDREMVVKWRRMW
ncbi:hypothetical protein PG989_016363 [Apiospora arundinis]